MSSGRYLSRHPDVVIGQCADEHEQGDKDERGATDQDRPCDRKTRWVPSLQEPRRHCEDCTEHEETTRDLKTVLEQKYQGRHADWKSKRSDHGRVQPDKMDRGETGEVRRR